MVFSKGKFKGKNWDNANVEVLLFFCIYMKILKYWNLTDGTQCRFCPVNTLYLYLLSCNMLGSTNHSCMMGNGILKAERCCTCVGFGQASSNTWSGTKQPFRNSIAFPSLSAPLCVQTALCASLYNAFHVLRQLNIWGIAPDRFNLLQKKKQKFLCVLGLKIKALCSYELRLGSDMICLLK